MKEKRIKSNWLVVKSENNEWLNVDKKLFNKTSNFWSFENLIFIKNHCLLIDLDRTEDKGLISKDCNRRIISYICEKT